MQRALLTLCVLLGACAPAAKPPLVRPDTWAQPVDSKAVDNWYRVSADLYRCAQPSASQMRALEAFGIKSVVNLREYHSDKDETAGTKLQIAQVPVGAGDLTYAQLVTAVKALVAAPKPVVVHCWRGADRTGAVVAAWRVAVDAWQPAEAVEEMAAGGFGHAALYDNLRELVAGLDAVKLRADVGLPPK